VSGFLDYGNDDFLPDYGEEILEESFEEEPECSGDVAEESFGEEPELFPDPFALFSSTPSSSQPDSPPTTIPLFYSEDPIIKLPSDELTKRVSFAELMRQDRADNTQDQRDSKLSSKGGQ